MFLQRNSIGQPQRRSRRTISTPFSDYLPYYENLHKLQTSYRTNVLTKFFSVVANFLTRACGPHRSGPENLQSDRNFEIGIYDVRFVFLTYWRQCKVMTSDSIDAMPLHRIVTSNDVDMGLKSGQPALGKMLLLVKFWLDFLDFWQVESWLKYPKSGENSFSKYLFAEKLRPRLVMHLYFDVSHDVSVNIVF